MSQLTDNLLRIRESIAAAAERSNRAADAVTLVAVTKTVDARFARELALVGCCDLGEGRPQELWAKQAALVDLPIHWHLVGHLQRNKVERTLPLVSLIHSVDSLRLMQSIESAANALSRTADVLLEVNISGDATKHGLLPDELPDRFAEARQFDHVRIRGLMGMASLEGDSGRARREFRRLRELRDRLRNSPRGGAMQELSMGMSGDYEVAIEEGATIVRIGTALFEGVA